MKSSIRAVARDAVTLADRALSHVGARFERPSLIPFLFHSVFEDRAEVETDALYPQEAVTRDGLRALIESFLAHDCRFVTAADIEVGLDGSRSCVWLTFDDGYANNLRMGEIVREYGVPATLFVATGYVERGRRFWWDTVYSERRRHGVPVGTIERELQSLKRRPYGEIVSYVAREFGPDAHSPRSDLDRPLTPHELAEFARAGDVEIGNHTVDHAILPLLAPEQIEAQLRGAQEYLFRLTGALPRSVSYPNGGCDDRVVDVAGIVGFPVGVTTVPRKNRLPVSGRPLELGRFQLRRGEDLEVQARVIRSEVQVGNAVRRLRRRAGGT